MQRSFGRWSTGNETSRPYYLSRSYTGTKEWVQSQAGQNARDRVPALSAFKRDFLVTITIDTGSTVAISTAVICLPLPPSPSAQSSPSSVPPPPGPSPSQQHDHHRHHSRHHHPHRYHHYVSVASLVPGSSKVNFVLPAGSACCGIVTRCGTAPVVTGQRGRVFRFGGTTPMG